MQSTSNNGIGRQPEPLELDQSAESYVKEPEPDESPSAEPESEETVVPVTQFARRGDADKTAGTNRNKILLIAGGLLAAILFFVLTTFIGKPAGKKKTPSPQAHMAQQSAATKGSVTPLMDTPRNPVQNNTGGQLSPNDISRTKATNGGPQASKDLIPQPEPTTKAGTTATLGNVPSFGDTQQRWEEPRPYGGAEGVTSPQSQQQQNLLKEPSLVFVRNVVQASTSSSKMGSSDSTEPVLDFPPGTRVLAKLKTEASSAVLTPVVAEVQYTYSLGDHVVIPAGARFIGHLEQADRSGLVNIRFDELDLSDDDKERVEAVGLGLDLSPIKGTVYGKNTGRNFLVRTASGIGSVAAMVVGNNTSASFSEDDLIRERIAENIGTAGDSEIMNLAVTNKVFVSVPADTKIYVVFAKRGQSSATTTLHPVGTAQP